MPTEVRLTPSQSLLAVLLLAAWIAIVITDSLYAHLSIRWVRWAGVGIAVASACFLIR